MRGITGAGLHHAIFLTAFAVITLLIGAGVNLSVRDDTPRRAGWGDRRRQVSATTAIASTTCSTGPGDVECINLDVADGRALGVQETATFFLDGE